MYIEKKMRKVVCRAAYKKERERRSRARKWIIIEALDCCRLNPASRLRSGRVSFQSPSNSRPPVPSTSGGALSIFRFADRWLRFAIPSVWSDIEIPRAIERIKWIRKMMKRIIRIISIGIFVSSQNPRNLEMDLEIFLATRPNLFVSLAARNWKN